MEGQEAWPGSSAAAVAGLERDNLALVHQLSQERQHGREVEAEWARRLDTARQQHRDNLASLAALVAAQNKVTACSPPYSSILPCQVGREWRSEMSSLTTKYNTKLRAAQQRNKELRAELAKLQVRPNELSPSYHT